MASSLCFHNKKGSNVTYSNNNRTATRADFDNGVVFSNRKLKNDEIFQLRLDQVQAEWMGSITFGVIACDPNSVSVPRDLTAGLKYPNVLWSNKSIITDTTPTKNYSNSYLENVKNGDILGVKRTSKGAVHFYINGRDQGVASPSVSANIWAVADLYGMVTEVTITTAGQQASLGASAASGGGTGLVFHTHCGQNATVFNNCRTVKRDEQQYNCGVALTSRKLKADELFEVILEEMTENWSGPLEIGVTNHDPDHLEFPATMSDIRKGTWLMSGRDLVVDGTKKNNKYGHRLEDLTIGDTVGVKRKKDGELHYYINSKDLGVAAKGVPDGVFGVVDVFGQARQVSVTGGGGVAARPASATQASVVPLPPVGARSSSYNTAEGVKVTIKTGSITAERVDAIVNTTRTDLDLSAGNISKAILAAAGPAVQTECSQKYPNGIAIGEAAETGSGKLSCQAIYHGGVANYNDGKGKSSLTTYVENVLMQAHRTNRKSIAFPAIGTGVLGYPIDEVAKIMRDAIKAFSKVYSSTTLKDIRIVLFDSDALVAFETIMKAKQVVQPVPKKGPKQKLVIDFPSDWTVGSHGEIYVEELSPINPLYGVVQKAFVKTGGPDSVLKIERIQSPNLYSLYCIRRSQAESTMDKRRFKEAERVLYHGTAQDAIDSINRNGFNRAYCGKNAHVYGKGVYFARDATYSARNTYSVPNSQGLKFIYQCKVITGEYTAGVQDMLAPPQKDPQGDPNVLLDTVVDDVNDPQIFVTFHDAMAYPEYLITFR